MPQIVQKGSPRSVFITISRTCPFYCATLNTDNYERTVWVVYWYFYIYRTVQPVWMCLCCHKHLHSVHVLPLGRCRSTEWLEHTVISSLRFIWPNITVTEPAFKSTHLILWWSYDPGLWSYRTAHVSEMSHSDLASISQKMWWNVKINKSYIRTALSQMK